MKKLLTASDWLLLALSKSLDIYQEIRDPFNLLQHYYENYLGIYTSKFSKHNASQLVHQNLKTHNIKKIVYKNQVYFELTGQGKEKIVRKFPLLALQKKTWDKKWRLVMYDVAEKKKRIRNYLRNKLREFGFAELQKSVFISPHDFLKDIHEFLEERSLLHNVILIETENFFAGNIKELANQLWHLDKINTDYKEICDFFHYHKKIDDRLRESEQVRILRWKLIYALLNDPYLPEEFLPEGWCGEKVRKLLRHSHIL